MIEAKKTRRELITIEDFTALSAGLHYQLIAKFFDPRMLLQWILGPARFKGKPEPLLQSIGFLRHAYEGKKRLVGSPAILHPLRTAALLARVLSSPTTLEFLGALFHDKDEDLELYVDQDKMTQKQRDKLEEEFKALEQKIDQDDRWYLGERIALLTREKNQSYHEYIGDILDNARTMPDLLVVKMADRLDNSLDLHIQHPGITRINFYKIVFDILFVPTLKVLNIGDYHFMPPEEGGVLLLSQLFKNCIFLSLLRVSKLDNLNPITKRLFDALAVASIRAAQWLSLSLFATCITDVEEQRRLLQEVMRYCESGGAGAIRRIKGEHDIDGIFLGRYAVADHSGRSFRLAKLYRDKELLAKISVVFIATFASFLNDKHFYVHGIDRTGTRAVE